MKVFLSFVLAVFITSGVSQSRAQQAPPNPEPQALRVTSAAAATPAVASRRPAIFIGEPPGVRGEGMEGIETFH